jgi:hypothetical protein
VLHHEADPHRLISECVRVSRRLLIIKDHKVEGFMAQQRIALLDWAANAPYGVPCLYRYNTPGEWEQWKRRHSLEIEAELGAVRLYPFPYHLIFTKKLQYLAVYRVPGGGAKIGGCRSSSGSERASSTSNGSAPSSTPATAG